MTSLAAYGVYFSLDQASLQGLRTLEMMTTWEVRQNPSVSNEQGQRARRATRAIACDYCRLKKIRCKIVSSQAYPNLWHCSSLTRKAITGDRENHVACSNCRQRGRPCAVPDRRRRSHKDNGSIDMQERLARIEACLQQANTGHHPISTSPPLHFTTSLASSTTTTYPQPATNGVHDPIIYRETIPTSDQPHGSMGAPSPRLSMGPPGPTTAVTRPALQARMSPFEQQITHLLPSRSSFQLGSTSRKLPDASDTPNESGTTIESPDEIRERTSILSSEIVSTLMLTSAILYPSIDKFQEQLGIPWCVSTSHNTH